MELDASGICDLRSGGLISAHVPTVNRVAEQLGEDEDWLRDVTSEMEIEDGVIGVYGVGEDGVLAFTDFGIESLRCSSVKIRNIDQHAAYAGCLPGSALHGGRLR